MTYAVILLEDDEQPVETGPTHHLRNAYVLARADTLGDIMGAAGELVDVDAAAGDYLTAIRARAERANATPPPLTVVLSVALVASELARMVVFAGRVAWRRWRSP